MSIDKSSDLARELGAIASGEEASLAVRGHAEQVTKNRTERFATGLVRLIDERIALALGDAVKHNPPSDGVKPAAVAIGDTVDHGPGTAVYEVTRLENSGSVARLSGDGAWGGKWISALSLVDPHHGWRIVRAVDVPKAAEPAPGVVAVGDTFLRLTAAGDRWAGGEVVYARGITTSLVDISGPGVCATARPDDLLHSGDWQRVPAGHVLPSAIEWHAATVRLIEAYKASLADPETGLRGAHECMREMARMAGMDVPA